jgi:HSP20 family protein
MTLMLRKPQNRVAHMRDGFGRMFEEFFNVTPWAEEDFNWAPRADIHETENEYLVQLDLPGLEKSDVKIKLEDGNLTVSGERKNEVDVEDEKYHRVERFHGSFSRSFRLYKNVERTRIKAGFKNGVLEITIPKADEVKPKEIEID